MDGGLNRVFLRLLWERRGYFSGGDLVFFDVDSFEIAYSEIGECLAVAVLCGEFVEREGLSLVRPFEPFFQGA